MKYYTFKEKNITVSDWTPNKPGTGKIGKDGLEWKEVKLPDNPRDRKELVKNLSRKNKRVWLKTASGFGRARLFITN